MFRISSMIQTGCQQLSVKQLLRRISSLAYPAILCVIVQAVATPQLAAMSKTDPNIVVILVDDMGYGDPGCYNSESKIATPNIDSLAQDGMRFTDAHASGPLCHLSRYGLMTGRYPFRATPERWRKEPTIKSGETTIASLLKANGYQTAMVGKWHLGFAENGYDKPLPGGPVDCGFGSYFGIRASTDIPPYFYIRGDRALQAPTNQIADNFSDGWTKIQGAFWRAGGIAPNLELKDVLPRFTDEAVKVIEARGKANTQERKPLMLYLAYPAPHTPWLPSPEFQGKSKAGMYGDFAMMVDSEIGRVLASIEAAGMSDDTMVVFTSDNGPVWYENDVERFGHDSSGGLRGMKADAWECGHRMPFVVRWPNVAKPFSVCHQTICFTDLLATFADVVDATLPDAAAPDSFSFHSVLTGAQGENDRGRDELAVRSGGGLMTFRSGDWKLIQGLGSGGFSAPRRVKAKPGEAKGQLYNLATDPAEQTNVYSTHPKVVAGLTERLEQVVAAGRHRP